MKQISMFGGSLTVHPVFLAIIAITVFLGNVGVVMAFMLAIVLHECAHIVTANAVGLTVESLHILPFGCAAQISGYANAAYAKEILTAAAGPAMNLFTASLIALLPKEMQDDMTMLFIWANIMVAAINMLPVLPLDGGRILMAVMKNILREKTAWRILNGAGMAAGAILSAWGFTMILDGNGGNITMLVMGAFLFGYAAISLKNLPFASYRDAEEKRKRLARRGSVNVKNIAVMRNATIRDVLREMESSKLNIITVLNDDYSIRGQISEVKMLDAAAKFGVEKKVGELTYK